MGVFGFGVVLAPAVGPSFGGVLVEHFGWRSIFFFVVPFCAVRAVAGAALPAGVGAGRRCARRAQRALDVPGLALAAVAVLGLLNGLVHLHDASPRSAALLLGTGAVALALFVWHESRTPRPLLVLRLFRSRPFAMGGVVAFIYGMGLFGSTYLVPVFMQSALHFPPSQAGAALMPAGLVLALTIPLPGGSPTACRRRLVAAGLALLALSFALMATVSPGTRCGC